MPFRRNSHGWSSLSENPVSASSLLTDGPVRQLTIDGYARLLRFGGPALLAL